jgi:hypothetical protein
LIRQSVVRVRSERDRLKTTVEAAASANSTDETRAAAKIPFAGASVGCVRARRATAVRPGSPRAVLCDGLCERRLRVQANPAEEGGRCCKKGRSYGEKRLGR